MAKKIDITGLRFGKLLVVRQSDSRNSSNDILWECKCDCGGTKLVLSGALRHGLTKSCGCMMGSPVHGDWNKRIRIIWKNMMRRCYSKTDRQYPAYGGRRIRVCKAWHNYMEFKKWAFENGYDDELTIERVKVNKGYSPDNCKWATYKEQNNNRRNNHRLRINGESKTIAQWSEIYGINQARIKRRLSLGWSNVDAVSKPINKNKIANQYR